MFGGPNDKLKNRPFPRDGIYKPTNFEEYMNPPVLAHVFEGGALPERQTPGAVGYDARVRAIVSPFDMDEKNPVLRKTVFDFRNPPQELLDSGLVREGNDGKWAYILRPGTSVLVGIGFATAMPQGVFYWVAPRSGLASKLRITLANAPGTVDPDYRGEAGVIVLNESDVDFEIKWDMRIAQIIFGYAPLPDLIPVEKHSDLPPSIRGEGGFGSTGNEGSAPGAVSGSGIS